MKDQSYFDQLQDILVESFSTESYLYQIKMHYHNGLELIYFDAADGYMLVGGVRYRAEAGTALLINSYQLHTPVDILPGARYSRILITVDEDTAKGSLERLGLGELWALLSSPSALRVPEKNDPEGTLRFRFHAIQRQKELGGPLCLEQMHGELALLLGDFARLCASYSSSQGLETGQISGVRGILSYLDRHYRESVSLEQLEQRFFLSRNHICRSFKKATGLTVSQYVNRRRMTDVQRMLRSSGLPIAEICYAVGFGDVAYFTKLFNRITGCTPSQYRRAAREVNATVSTF